MFFSRSSKPLFFCQELFLASLVCRKGRNLKNTKKDLILVLLFPYKVHLYKVWAQRFENFRNFRITKIIENFVNFDFSGHLLYRLCLLAPFNDQLQNLCCQSFIFTLVLRVRLVRYGTSRTAKCAQPFQIHPG